MGIMTRFTRLCRADIHGVMDHIENKELMLKQCLREMEESLTKKQGDLKHLKACLDQKQNEIRQIRKENEKNEQDLEIAINKGKDDIARILIKKRLKAERFMAAARQDSESAEKQINLLSESIEAQKHQYTEMQLKTELWIQNSAHRKWEKCTSGIIPEAERYLISDEEIELELIKHKDKLKGGGCND